MTVYLSSRPTTRKWRLLKKVHICMQPISFTAWPSTHMRRRLPWSQTRDKSFLVILILTPQQRNSNVFLTTCKACSTRMRSPVLMCVSANSWSLHVPRTKLSRFGTTCLELLRSSTPSPKSVKLLLSTLQVCTSWWRWPTRLRFSTCLRRLWVVLNNTQLKAAMRLDLLMEVTCSRASSTITRSKFSTSTSRMHHRTCISLVVSRRSDALTGSRTISVSQLANSKAWFSSTICTLSMASSAVVTKTKRWTRRTLNSPRWWTSPAVLTKLSPLVTNTNSPMCTCKKRKCLTSITPTPSSARSWSPHLVRVSSLVLVKRANPAQFKSGCAKTTNLSKKPPKKSKLTPSKSTAFAWLMTALTCSRSAKMACLQSLMCVTATLAARRSNSHHSTPVKRSSPRNQRWRKNLLRKRLKHRKTTTLWIHLKVKVLRLVLKRNAKPIRFPRCNRALKAIRLMLNRSISHSRKTRRKPRITTKTSARTSLTVSKKSLRQSAMSTPKRCLKTPAVSTSSKCKRKRSAWCTRTHLIKPRRSIWTASNKSRKLTARRSK